MSYNDYFENYRNIMGSNDDDNNGDICNHCGGKGYIEKEVSVYPTMGAGLYSAPFCGKSPILEYRRINCPICFGTGRKK